MRWIYLLILLPAICLAQPSRIGRRAALIAAQAVPVAAGGGATTNLYESTATVDSTISLDAGYVEGDDVVVTTGGTLRYMELRIAATTATSNLKLQVYSGGTLVSGASGAVNIPIGSITTAYVRINCTATLSSSTTYRVRAINDGQLLISALGGQSGKGHYTSGQLYADWPKATDVADSGTEGKIIQFRLGVEQ